ncbi:MAG TPA: hypothetical protein DD979_12020 [Gammaproteobacteria bacterium]|nr:hypothetical protein [Gammaproteobacteria bacterium]
MTSQRKPVKTLAQQVRAQLLWVGVGLFFACLVLMLIFAIHATSITVGSLMQLEANSLLRQLKEDPESPLPQGQSLSAYRQWQDIPQTIRDYFGEQPASGEVRELTVEDGEQGMIYLYLLRHADEDLAEIFLLSHHDQAEMAVFAEAFFKSALQQAFWLTVIIFVGLFFLVHWLIRRTAEPMAWLSTWAAALGENPARATAPDSPIEEVNQLAEQLREGIDRIHAYNLREREFLSYASHELRTPLAIIQASLDTLELQQAPPHHAAVQRAQRASATMRRLSSALLWLARESTRPIPKEPVNVGALCDQIIHDHRYLLQGRNITLSTDIASETLAIERELLAIVVANMVRNAFQHSAEGEINLKATAERLSLSNPVAPQDKASTTNHRTNNGLGLQLVQRICDKLGWQLHIEQSPAHICVTVHWCKPLS